MRGGLVTTDMEGRVVLLNRTGEEILGRTFAELRGRDLREVSAEFWQHEISTLPEKLSLRREIEVRIPGGQRRYLGISVSPLRTRDTQRSGFVFNFQDLTELRRLEQEVATKERMAAVGRLSAAIAHEIRQPLTAMAGAVKELARLGASGRRRKAPGEHREQGIGETESNHYGFPEFFAREVVRISRNGCAAAAGRNADVAGTKTRRSGEIANCASVQRGRVRGACGCQQDETSVLEPLR